MTRNPRRNDEGIPDRRGRFIGQSKSEADIDSLPSNYGYEIHESLIQSRDSLCRVIEALGKQSDAVTVIGSHAVHERTKELDLVSTATKDGDLALTPELTLDSPVIPDVLRSAGFRPLTEIAAELPENHRGKRWASRPGLWGTGIDEFGAPIDEVDLLVPELLAGKRGRSAKTLPAHGKAMIGRVSGIELAILDRDKIPLENYIDGSTRDVWVSDAAGLICAKAFKITDRLADTQNRARNLPKDILDMWRCLAVSDPEKVLHKFMTHENHSELGSAVREGRRRVIHILDLPIVETSLRDQLEIDSPSYANEVTQVLAAWKLVFHE